MTPASNNWAAPKTKTPALGGDRKGTAPSWRPQPQNVHVRHGNAEIGYSVATRQVGFRSRQISSIARTVLLWRVAFFGEEAVCYVTWPSSGGGPVLRRRV
jgi:hypothetical protein